MTRVLVTGATGAIGGRLLRPLLDGGHSVRALVRDPARADLPDAVEVVRGDVVSGAGLVKALAGVDTAYYLVHAMGRGNGRDFERGDRIAAANVGTAAARAGTGRVVYLGGLEPTEARRDSAHLRSREEVARLLAEHVPGTVHVRAAMVITADSSSFVMLRALVERLPAMVCPRWIDTRSQPVAVDDVVATLAALADSADVPAEVQVGGADVLTYREMMSRFAVLAGRRAPLIVRVPVLTPRLSSYWVQLVTPVEAALVRPLVAGLGAEMLVRTPPPAGLNDAPRGFDDAVRAALREASDARVVA